MSNQNSNSPRNTSANNKMLIDATHPEETRVVVQRNGRVEEFDFESAARKLLRGNIYLAKVTRVEPSLQAAFVDYGGNRHGFLAFNEIHPDYYQIPIADRRALIEAETAAEAEEEAAADRAAEAAARRSRRRDSQRPRPLDEAEDNAIDVSSMMPPETIETADDLAETPVSERGEERARDHLPDEEARSLPERTEADPVVRAEAEPERPAMPADSFQSFHAPAEGPASEHVVEHLGQPPSEASEGGGEGRVETVETGNGAEAEQIETVSESEDVLEEVPVRPRRRLRSYKIQEVIKRRQVLLVQVVKEERGTKGAALTTYLSLAGRYTVLMPNTARGGGISRKINNPQDRKRLKAIAAELDVPEGMGLIIRTAGAARTKQEIKRDYEYLLRLWESVRELALGSNAPALVYEEGNLIKRSIRDLYGKEVEEIIVAGDAAFREARDFMRMLMPSHAKNVHFYEEPEPLFTRFGMERQLNAMFSPYVHLRSGGYLVINQTEALVAIDINSGKSTREFSIEETALSTNLEAAEEIARQVKLRDLAGLIVIDFIDMEEKRNNRAVERRLKDALRHDRARIQLGRISHFGLLEMSRQRMRTGVLEGSTTQCPHCQGTGIIRSTESVALAVLRGLEDALMNGPPASLIATTTSTVALYILNHKRSFIVEMENRYGITIQILASEKVQGANFTVERQARREEPQRRADRGAVNMDWGFEDEDQAEEAVEDIDGETGAEGERDGAEPREGQGGEGRRRRRRRRGRRGERESEGGQRQPYHGRDGERLDAAERNGDGRSRGAEGYGERAAGAHYDDSADEPEPIYEAGAAGDLAEGDGEDEEGVARSEAGEGHQGERRRRRRRGRRGGRRNQQGRERPFEGEGNGHAQDVLAGGSGEVAEERNGADVRAEVSDGYKALRHADEREGVAQRDHAPVGLAAEPEQRPGEPEIRAEQTAAVVPEAKAEVSERRPEAAEPEPEMPKRSVLEQETVATEPAEAQPVTPAPNPRSAPVASEPVLARVVVRPDTGAAAQAAEEEAKPARRGWWQRR
jgi:ribonuclease E